MTLQKYRQKRNFKRTKEPFGKPQKSGHNLYVIQKHDASHLHYDFRIELNGVLKSWAVPKGPSLDPSVKHLAVEVEDHPLEYGSFEGIIPEHEYGGGTVMLWDRGSFECLDEDLQKAYQKGSLTLILHGERLKGKWKLIRLKSDPKNWLLFKIKDEYARPEKQGRITEEALTSVVSQRTMDEIADNLPKKKIKQAKLPGHVSPELATFVSVPPESDHWLHEIKFDGYRILCFIHKGTVSLITRGQKDWTHKFPHLVADIKKLKIKEAILDGEIAVLDEDHISRFQLLQNRIAEKKDHDIQYFLFDILYHNGHDLTSMPLIQRKSLLQELLSSAEQTVIHYSDHVIGHGKEVFESACKLGLEGVVSKKIDSPYVQKRTRSWLKAKCKLRQEFVVVGYTKPKNTRSYFGSLLLGFYNKDHQLHYCGHVGTGFTQASLKSTWQMLQKYKTQISPISKRPPKIRAVTWVEPKLIAEVEFAEWTSDHIIRQASFHGLRQNKAPLTNPDRILYPDKGYTKLDLAQYYEKIQDWILPHIINRPLTLLRCPSGQDKKCFFQKHLLKNDEHSDVYTVPEGIYIKNFEGLLTLVQWGVLEIHTWGSRVDKIENPDRIVFDLDPSKEVKWKQVIDTAFLIKRELEQIHLQSFVTTTGGKGLHVVVPIKPSYSWKEVQSFAHTFVDYLVVKEPKLYIGTMSKSKRTGKIFIDYMRNHRGSTFIAPYSTRAHQGAPIATPLSWEELSVRIKSNSFTMANLPRRLEELKEDPWKGIFKLKQRLGLSSVT